MGPEAVVNSIKQSACLSISAEDWWQSASVSRPHGCGLRALETRHLYNCLGRSSPSHFAVYAPVQTRHQPASEAASAHRLA
ncbi:unnamed protein product [Protopolystoma xenopodis]|uniref:Uncharacterized protein n=1 Tax=Protopolystoma xenopodis TaxID=117903 RepID=A0A448XS06_9PLAT|nr:unnamed protein product [Protopolystoma xenopodis]